MQDKFQFFPMLVPTTNIISSLLCLKTMKKDKIMVKLIDYGCIDNSKKMQGRRNVSYFRRKTSVFQRLCILKFKHTLISDFNEK